jgi:hypothetical protein
MCSYGFARGGNQAAGSSAGTPIPAPPLRIACFATTRQGPDVLKTHVATILLPQLHVLTANACFSARATAGRSRRGSGTPYSVINHFAMGQINEAECPQSETNRADGATKALHCTLPHVTVQLHLTVEIDFDGFDTAIPRFFTVRAIGCSDTGSCPV